MPNANRDVAAFWYDAEFAGFASGVDVECPKDFCAFREGSGDIERKARAGVM